MNTISVLHFLFNQTLISCRVYVCVCVCECLACSNILWSLGKNLNSLGHESDATFDLSAPSEGCHLHADSQYRVVDVNEI